MEIIAPGSKVTIGDKFDAVVLAISIRQASVQYEVAWWNGNDRKSAWLEANEVTPGEVKPLVIGFRS